VYISFFFLGPCTLSLQNPYAPPYLEGAESTLIGLSTPVFIGAATAAAVAAGAAGATGGKALAGDTGRLAGAAVGAAVVAYAAKSANEKRQGLAVKDLISVLSQLEDPQQITRAQVDAIGAKFGVDMTEEPEMSLVMLAFINAVMPSKDGKLTGREADLIQGFAAQLGVSERITANAFIDYGRAITRAKLETGSLAQKQGETTALKRCIYTAERVLGAQTAALLCAWSRNFNISPEVVLIAKRDCAKQLMMDEVAAPANGDGGLALDDAALAALRAKAEALGLQQEPLVEIIQEQVSVAVETLLVKAGAAVKVRGATRDTAAITVALTEALAINARVSELAALVDGSTAPYKGLSPVSLNDSKKAAEVGSGSKELLRVFVEENTKDQMTDEAESALVPLGRLLSVTDRVATDIIRTAKEAAYKRLLREAYASGRLADAESPAAVLNELVERLQLDHEQYLDIPTTVNTEVYNLRWDQILEKNKLTEADEGELATLQRCLCITDGDAASIREAKTGRFYTKAVGEAFAAGVDGFGQPERDLVKKAMADFRIVHETAVKLLREAGEAAFMTYINQSRMKANDLERAKELKRLILFNQIVLTPLMVDAKGPELLAKEAQEREEKRKQMIDISKMLKDAQNPKKQAEMEAKEAAKEEGEDNKDDDDVDKTVDLAAKEEGEKTSEDDAEKTPEELAAEAKEQAEIEAQADAMLAAQEKADCTIPDAPVGLDTLDKKNTYRLYLRYAVTGDVAYGPMGVVMQTERDPAEFKRLAELGRILGLGPQETSSIQQEFAEEAFRAQAKGIVGSGNLTPQREAALVELQNQLGLPDSTREKFVAGIKNRALLDNLAEKKRTGQLTPDAVMEVLEANDDPSALAEALSEDSRKSIYREWFESMLQDGKGALKAEEAYAEMPKKLKIEDAAAKIKYQLVKEANVRKGLSTTQAVADYRLGMVDKALLSLQNVVSSQRASGDVVESAKKQPEDMKLELLCFFISKETDETKHEDLSKALCYEDKLEAARDMVKQGWSPKGGSSGTDSKADEKAFF